MFVHEKILFASEFWIVFVRLPNGDARKISSEHFVSWGCFIRRCHCLRPLRRSPTRCQTRCNRTHHRRSLSCRAKKGKAEVLELKVLLALSELEMLSSLLGIDVSHFVKYTNKEVLLICATFESNERHIFSDISRWSDYVIYKLSNSESQGDWSWSMTNYLWSWAVAFEERKWSP